MLRFVEKNEKMDNFSGVFHNCIFALLLFLTIIVAKKVVLLQNDSTILIIRRCFMSLQTSRRDFLKASTIAGVGFMVGAGNSVQIARASALQGIALAGIGIGGKGSSDIDRKSVV